MIDQDPEVERAKVVDINLCGRCEFKGLSAMYEYREGAKCNICGCKLGGYKVENGQIVHVLDELRSSK